jgi:FtsH-binding integral membrane protein
MSWQTPTQGNAALDQIVVEQSQRTFMARVYRWMFLGLGVTGAVALYTASSPALLQIVLPHFMLLLIAEFLLVLGLSFAAPRVSGPVAGGLFLLYATMNGLTLSAIFLAFELGSIGEAFLLTAGTFGALSAYATFTKKDLSAWRSFLFIGLFGVVIAGVVQLFWHNPGFSFVWSCACVVVFAGLTAYDTQKLRQMHAGAGYTSAASLSVTGALMLYLDFVNLFLALLRLFGRRR